MWIETDQDGAVNTEFIDRILVTEDVIFLFSAVTEDKYEIKCAGATAAQSRYQDILAQLNAST